MSLLLVPVLFASWENLCVFQGLLSLIWVGNFPLFPVSSHNKFLCVPWYPLGWSMFSGPKCAYVDFLFTVCLSPGIGSFTFCVCCLPKCVFPWLIVFVNHWFCVLAICVLSMGPANKIFVSGAQNFWGAVVYRGAGGPKESIWVGNSKP